MSWREWFYATPDEPWYKVLPAAALGFVLAPLLLPIVLVALLREIARK